MSLRQAIRAALDLLSPRDRRILLLVISIQAGLALLDLVGVALLGIVAGLGASAVTGNTPAALTAILDSVALSTTDPLILSLMLAIVAACVLVSKSILSFLLTRRAFRFLASRQAMISGKLATDLLSRPLLFIQRRSSQETAYALTAGANAATLGVLGNAVIIASEIALIVVLAAGLAFVDLLVTVFTIVFFVFVGLALHRVLANWAGRLGVQMSRAEVDSYAAVQEFMRTYREVIVTGRRSLHVDRFRNLRWLAARVQANYQIMNQVSKYVFEVALIIGGGLLALSQLLTRDATAAVAVIAVFLAASSRIMPSLLRMQTSSLNIRSSAGVAEPTFDLAQELRLQQAQEQELRARPGDVLDDQTRRRIESGLLVGHPGFTADVRLDRISMSYPGSLAPALVDVSLQVLSGSSLAVVGSTGAGKSTLADLMLGVLVPDGGSVTIGGDAPSVAIAKWPGAITYVPQDIAVVNGTIRDNVALGLPPDLVLDQRIWEALERAQLARFLSAQREGLDTVVGEHGMRLSGGQRQRLGLARALYTRPKLIVLDEATSALDAETEQAVSQTMVELEGEVTLIIIAHRLATIRNCDQVAYLGGGRLAAIGTFAEVRDQAPDFDHQAQLLGL